MKLLEIGGARAPVPHSWRRHWILLRAMELKLLYTAEVKDSPSDTR